MPVSSSRKGNKKSVNANKNESRASLEQRALEGRGRDIYKYFRKNGIEHLADENLLYLSFLWLQSDPQRELSVDEFMELTPDQINDRFDKLKSKGHLKKLTDFNKVVELYALQDGKVQVPHRYAE